MVNAGMGLLCALATPIRLRVVSVIEEMGLLVCADTGVVDVFVKVLSGGHTRRLSIAVELLDGPPVLLLDESTFSLDFASAFQVVEHLKMITSKRHTVAMSIHQLSSATFALFSKIVLLTKGKFVNCGALGQSAIDHFASAGHPIPDYTNPADFFLDVFSTDFKPATSKHSSTSKGFASSSGVQAYPLRWFATQSAV